MVEIHSSTTNHANKKSACKRREYITPASSQLNDLNRKKGTRANNNLVKEYGNLALCSDLLYFSQRKGFCTRWILMILNLVSDTVLWNRLCTVR